MIPGLELPSPNPFDSDPGISSSVTVNKKSSAASMGVMNSE